MSKDEKRLVASLLIAFSGMALFMYCVAAVESAWAGAGAVIGLILMMYPMYIASLPRKD